MPTWHTPSPVRSSHMWLSEYSSHCGVGNSSAGFTSRPGCAIPRYSSQYRWLSDPHRESTVSLYGMNFVTGAAEQYCIKDSRKYGQAPSAAPSTDCTWYTPQLTWLPDEHFSCAEAACASGIMVRRA